MPAFVAMALTCSCMVIRAPFASGPIRDPCRVVREYARDNRVDLFFELRDVHVKRHFGARTQEFTTAGRFPDQHDECSRRIFRVHTGVSVPFGAHIDVASPNGPITDNDVSKLALMSD